MILEDEKVLFKSRANAMKRLEGVGGMLYLTENALYHKPHKLNIQSGETYIPLEDIKLFETKDDLFIIRNSLLILTKGNELYKFRVSNRKEWVIQLNKILG